MTATVRSVICTCLTYLALHSASYADKQGVLSHNGEQYSYTVHAPPETTTPRTLLLVLHGYGETADLLRNTALLDDYGDANESLVIYPQALKDHLGQPHWNVGTQGATRDDVGFLLKLLQQTQARHTIAPEHSFILGYSNGGYMAYRINCRFGGVFAGMVVIAGTMSGDDWQDCAPTHPKPVLHIHGTEDEVVAFGGAPKSEDGWGGAPAIETVINQWAHWNGAMRSSEERAYSNASVTTFYDSDARMIGTFAKILDGGHDYPVGNDNEYFATAEAWSFFNTLAQQ